MMDVLLVDVVGLFIGMVTAAELKYQFFGCFVKFIAFRIKFIDLKKVGQSVDVLWIFLKSTVNVLQNIPSAGTESPVTVSAPSKQRFLSYSLPKKKPQINYPQSFHSLVEGSGFDLTLSTKVGCQQDPLTPYLTGSTNS